MVWVGSMRFHGLVETISWWSAAYSRHVSQRCRGLQTTSLYDQTNHTWFKSTRRIESTRWLFLSLKINICIYSCMPLANRDLTFFWGERAFQRLKFQNSSVYGFCVRKLGGPLLNLGTRCSARTKYCSPTRLLLRPLFWYNPILYSKNSHLATFSQISSTHAYDPKHTGVHL